MQVPSVLIPLFLMETVSLLVTCGTKIFMEFIKVTVDIEQFYGHISSQLLQVFRHVVVCSCLVGCFLVAQKDVFNYCKWIPYCYFTAIHWIYNVVIFHQFSDLKPIKYPSFYLFLAQIGKCTANIGKALSVFVLNFNKLLRCVKFHMVWK